MTLYFLGLAIGLLIAVIIQYLQDYPIRFSSVKRFLPWVKSAQVIHVDFKNKRKINN